MRSGIGFVDLRRCEEIAHLSLYMVGQTIGFCGLSRAKIWPEQTTQIDRLSHPALQTPVRREVGQAVPVPPAGPQQKANSLTARSSWSK